LRLNLPRRTKRRVPRQPLTAPPVLNQTWALDFMSDTLYEGRRFRILIIMDRGNREGLAVEADISIPSARVVRILGELIATTATPGRCSSLIFVVTNLSREAARAFVSS
jgi:putative transposase